MVPCDELVSNKLLVSLPHKKTFGHRQLLAVFCILRGLWTGVVDEDVLGGTFKPRTASLRGSVDEFVISAQLFSSGTGWL
jgi:hypothetical protein